MRTLPTLIVTTLLCAPIPTFAQEADDWEFSVTPYLWLPVIEGSSRYSLPPGEGGSGDVSVGPTDWFDLLNFGALVSGSASKGKFSVFTDVVYLSMTAKNDGRVIDVRDGSDIIPIDVSNVLSTRTDLDGLAWTLVAGYQLVDTNESSVIAFAGARYFSVELSAYWELATEVTSPGGSVIWPAAGGISSDVNLLDGVIGARGEFVSGEKWTVPFYFDVGTGDSDLTWTAAVGAAREFGWGDLLFMYRHLEYDQGPDALLQDFSFSGPVIGARFGF